MIIGSEKSGRAKEMTMVERNYVVEQLDTCLSEGVDCRHLLKIPMDGDWASVETLAWLGTDDQGWGRFICTMKSTACTRGANA